MYSVRAHTHTHKHTQIRTSGLYLQGENYDQLKAENEMLKNELVENKQYVQHSHLSCVNVLYSKSSEYSANTGRLITGTEMFYLYHISWSPPRSTTVDL